VRLTANKCCYKLALEAQERAAPLKEKAAPTKR
jgi:hypothetical protein